MSDNDEVFVDSVVGGKLNEPATTAAADHSVSSSEEQRPFYVPSILVLTAAVVALQEPC